MTKIYFLRNSHIFSFRNETFVFYHKGAVNLKKLWLKENSIKELKTDTFMETKTLEIIFLNKNRISKIEDGAFNGLSHLIELILDENLIVAMTPHTFDGLVKLEALSLWNNKIKEIEVGAFNSLRSLQKLYLNENSCVKEFVFSNVTAENFEEVYKSCEPSKDYYR